MEEKFELTKETKVNLFGVKLFRIKAKVDGKYYKKGEIGGWVESLELKSGNERITQNAWVSGDAEVYGDARVYGNAEVYGNAGVYGNADVSENARLDKGYVFAYLETLTEFTTIKQENGVLFYTEFKKHKG